MSSETLSHRENTWQAPANVSGDKFVSNIVSYLKDSLPTDIYEITKEPVLFNLYYHNDRMKNPEKYIKQETPSADYIYYDETRKCFIEHFITGVEKQVKGGTCKLDICIKHLPTGNTYVIECKSQNDRGNAHERACKYLAQGMISAIQSYLNVTYHPIGYLYSGGMTVTEKYILEINTTHGPLMEHVLFIKPDYSEDVIIEKLLVWFNTTVAPLLESSPL
jgi:hypothetical protein